MVSVNSGFSADSLLPYKSNLTLQSASHDEKSARVKVIINDEEMQFPDEWLRLNCQCEQCFEPNCQSYILSYRQLVYDNTTISSLVMTENNSLRVVFSDKHVGEFGVRWLYNRRMTESGKEERESSIFIRRPVVWQDDMTVKRMSYNQVVEMGEGFEVFGDSMCKDGIFIISDCPDKPIIDEFVEKTGLTVLITHYGYFWNVKNHAKPTNFAYTADKIELHVDQPHLQTCPNLQYLHCIKQSRSGGENVMSDALKAAFLLRKRFPEHFKTLTTINVVYEDVIDHGKQFFSANSTPVILLDKLGDPESIRLSFACRSSFFNGPVEQWEMVSEALKEYYKLLYECSITLKLQPGEMMVFDNQRIMHGRLGFDSSEERMLEGWYSEWDTLLSYLRIAKIKKLRTNNS